MKKVMLSLVLALSLVVTPVSFNPSTAHASKKIYALKGKAYKKKCKRMYHDKLFFGKKKLKGKYVKVKCYLSESRYFQSYYDVPSYLKKYKVKRSLFYAKPERKGKKSYVSGGNIEIYFSKRTKSKYSKLKSGDYVMVYGQIVEYSTLSWDGYNGVAIIPKYIKKTKR